MATIWNHECSGCGYSFRTSGLHEYFIDANGDLKHYGHPLPESREAEAAGIAGFYADAWCLNADRNVVVVVREFEQAVGRHEGIWVPAALPEKSVTITCPACGDDTPI